MISDHKEVIAQGRKCLAKTGWAISNMALFELPYIPVSLLSKSNLLHLIARLLQKL